MLEDNTNFTKVHNIDDLQSLVKGDLVKLIFEYEPRGKYGKDEGFAAYHGLYLNGALEFVVPREIGGKYLSVHRQRKSLIEFRNGAVVLNEDKSSTQSYSPGDSNYKKFNQALELAGIR